MNKAWNVIASLNADDRERAIAEAYDRARWDEYFTKEGAIKEGIAIGEARGEAIGEARGISMGEARGEARRNIQIAREMLADGEPRAKILKFTRLTEEELDKLQ